MNAPIQPFSTAVGLVLPLARVAPPRAQLLGTCFIVGPQKLATLHHVVGGVDQNLAVIHPKIASLDDYQDAADASVNVSAIRIAADNPIYDLTVLSIDVPGELSRLTIGSSDDINVGEEVVIFGFPHAEMGRMILTMQRSEVGAKVLLQSGGLKIKHLVLNMQARPGQSGSPVVHFRSGKVVAVLVGPLAGPMGPGIMVAGVDPGTLHQTTYAVSAEYLGDML